MSNIVKARELLNTILIDYGNVTPKEVRNIVRRALRLMTREPITRRVKAKYVKITPEMKARIHRLAKTTDLSQSAIARKVGLPNAGRVSEVLHDKR